MGGGMGTAGPVEGDDKGVGTVGREGRVDRFHSAGLYRRSFPRQGECVQLSMYLRSKRSGRVEPSHETGYILKPTVSALQKAWHLIVFHALQTPWQHNLTAHNSLRTTGVLQRDAMVRHAEIV